ncbi:hypothetical protein FACS1894137_01540 [Spirochaetia bacterium]|nr:hypothetical protein FACS1894137_01540 [Spirochaetia bacterium]
MEKKRLFGGAVRLITAMLVFALSVVSCATTIPIDSVKMPTIDTTGIQRLGIVKDFDRGPGISGADADVLRRHLADKASELITATGKFTIVSPTDPNADGVFTGELTAFNTKDSQEQKQRNVVVNGQQQVQNYTEYKREVGVAFTYSIISGRTKMAIGTVSKSGSTSSTSNESRDKLAGPGAMAQSIVDSQIRDLSKDIVPYIVTEKLKLMKETSKDKVVKERMKTANALVKNKNYDEAIAQFDLIASETGSAAAKTNAGYIRQALAQTAAARAQLTELFNDKDGIAEKAVKKAADALNAQLPKGTVISIINTTDSNLTVFVVDELTKALMQTGNITVTDRSNQQLLAAEKQYQASGAVSDDSAVSIGNEIGVKYMVLCRVSGAMSGRRLNIRLLNIELNKVEYQDDVEI